MAFSFLLISRDHFLFIWFIYVNLPPVYHTNWFDTIAPFMVLILSILKLKLDRSVTIIGWLWKYKKIKYIMKQNKIHVFVFNWNYICILKLTTKFKHFPIFHYFLISVPVAVKNTHLNKHMTDNLFQFLVPFESWFGQKLTL